MERPLSDNTLVNQKAMHNFVQIEQNGDPLKKEEGGTYASCGMKKSPEHPSQEELPKPDFSYREFKSYTIRGQITDSHRREHNEI